MPPILILVMCTIWLSLLLSPAYSEVQRRLSSPEHHTFIEPHFIPTQDISDLDVYVVYFGYIYPKRHHWLDLIREQLDEFNCNGLAFRARKFYISLAVDFASETDKAVAELVNITMIAAKEIIPHAIFDLTLENRFEYPGIRKVWDIAQQIETDSEAHKSIILYMHSKGMANTYLPNFHAARVPLEIKLFHATFDRWDRVLQMYNKHEKLNKVGCLPSDEGNIWFNLFYVRASYVRTLVNPTIAKDRFYYEHWLKYIDQERYWPRMDHVEFAERDVHRSSTKNSGCAGCWSTCQGPQNETLGVSWPVASQPFDVINDLDWFKCRNKTYIPRKDIPFSINTY